jgi:glycosyltransferase involved in cell wall biosynthesis
MKNKNQYIDSNNIALLLPSYNEEKHIAPVIKSCAKYNLDIIVVDDGSTDNTPKILDELKKDPNLKLIVLRHETNKGKGEALKTGFSFVINNNYFGVITLDADGQHNIEEIKDFLLEINKNNPDIIVGSRFGNTKGMPFTRLLANYITSWIISLISFKKINDVQSGFRFIKSNVIKKIKLETSNFDTESEILIKASWNKYNITNVPIKTIYFPNEFKSHINPVKDTLKFFVLLAKSIGWRIQFKKDNWLLDH